MPFDVFWDMTPLELDYAFKPYLEDLQYKEQLSWEQLRTDVYYRYMMIPREKGKRALSYEQFKKKVFPLNFDKPTDDIDDTPDFEKIVEIFNKVEQSQIQVTTKVSATELKEMNI